MFISDESTTIRLRHGKPKSNIFHNFARVFHLNTGKGMGEVAQTHSLF